MTTSTSSKKRILFIITQPEMGGAQRFLFETISLLNKDKYEFSVASGSDGSDNFLIKLKELDVEYHSLKFLKREISIPNDLKAISEIKQLIKDFKPAVLFLNSSKAGFIGSLAARKIKNSELKVIYRIGGWTFNDPWPTWKKKLWIKLEKKSAPWKDIIIVNNQHDLEQAQKLGIKPRKKLTLIHNGLDSYKLNFLTRDEARFKLFEKALKHSGKIFQTEIVVGTIANLYPTKGLEYLIEAAEHFKKNANVSFFIIGEGNQRPKLENLIKEKGLEKQFFLLGQIPEARQYLQAFDVFVLPSVKEGFPWAVLEAMAARVPVVATRVGAISEIIESGKNGFIVEPKNPAALAGKIKDILSNDHLYKEFAIEGHQTVLFKFSEDKMVKEIESLL